jgi:hypothetical protein
MHVRKASEPATDNREPRVVVSQAGRLSEREATIPTPELQVAPPAAGRACDSCSLCCRVLEIVELDKPTNMQRQHCRPGKGGCAIHPERPPVGPDQFEWFKVKSKADAERLIAAMETITAEVRRDPSALRKLEALLKKSGGQADV